MVGLAERNANGARRAPGSNGLGWRAAAWARCLPLGWCYTVHGPDSGVSSGREQSYFQVRLRWELSWPKCCARLRIALASWRSAVRLPVYRDHGASTPVDPAVVARMLCRRFLRCPATRPLIRTSTEGVLVALFSRRMRLVGTFLAADVHGVIGTSGATESNNLAIKGIAQAHTQQWQAHRCIRGRA